ncbi:GNAT family N-acetyltransferase [Alphaproteobacteria bacterium]|nr:GNAT family N-acetyltransferase [Alphaproteobacteria bacterium]MDB4183976.1 GNAT family N-acetyltransferase [Alphaproteobacteria bacterium]MDB4233900.1 GNAT family N-acetyltransferase [Alphaproteobacteria bacterium]
MIEKPKEIHLTAWKEMFEKSQNNNSSKDNFNLFWTSALKEECFAFSAKNEGEFLGFIVASIFEGFFEKYLFLETIFVDQSYRKMGVGRALLNKVEEISLSLELDFFIHQVEKSNLVAQRLLNNYEKIDKMVYRKKFN